MEGKPLVVACIPAYNEEKTITRVVLLAQRYVDKVVVCDDGSTDLTGEIAEKLGAEVVRHERNLGKGAAFRSLFKRTEELGVDIVVTMDADGVHRAEDIPLLLEPVLGWNPDVDVVVGSRFMGGGFGPVSRLNFVGNKLINALIFLFTGRFLSDSQSGFRAFRRWVLDGLDLSSRGYEVESELSIKCVRRGCRIVEVPITCEKGLRVSRLSSFRDGFKILCTILKTVLLED